MSVLNVVLVGFGSGAYGAVGALIALALGKRENLTAFAQVVVALLWPVAMFVYGLWKVYEW